MSNNYGLPEDAVALVRKRDCRCVYCHKAMVPPNTATWRGDWATIEHLNHRPPWNNPETIAICCGSCNSSRGDKPLPKWLESRYCQERNISLATVARPVQQYLRKRKGRKR